jgi:endonuclease/exonuclease/phosphatase family metal-dependent hydrolase
MFRFGSERKRTLERAASKLGFCYSGLTPSRWSNLKPIDGGIMILSRYPAIEQDYIIYSQGVHADAWAVKGALSDLLQILAGIRLLVVCTHLQAEYPGHNFFHIQVSQVLELKAFLIRKHNQYPNVPIILAGDFNIGNPTTFINEAKGTSFSYALLLHVLSWNTSYQESEQLIRCLSSA